MTLKIGIIREGKLPLDRRVPLTPKQCRLVEDTWDTTITVQPSIHRAFTDDDYREQNIKVSEDLNECEVILGVKEVPLDMLIPNKTYLFFSHTYKRQPYNRELLRVILDKKIRLIDYELMRQPGGKRVLGFGRYAGIVGAYNAFRAWGERTGAYELRPAHECKDRKEVEAELIKVSLPQNCKIAITGAGRVAGGAMEILSALKITHVFPEEYLNQEFQEPVFTQVDVQHYYASNNGGEFDRRTFYNRPEDFHSVFQKYASLTDIYIACHFWSSESPYILKRDDIRQGNGRLKLVSDISCDIDGPIASTIRPSSIEEPFYGYDPETGKECGLDLPGSITVSAVDNLPCELPADASEDFGNELIKNVIPQFFNDDEGGILKGATETDLQGNLTPDFLYLQDYVDGRE